MTTIRPVNHSSSGTETAPEKITEQDTTGPEFDITQLPEPAHFLARLPVLVLDRLGALAGKIGLPILRTVLALVFLWFGALKITGNSDVFGLVAATVPWFNPHWFVPLLGSLEILLGIGLFIPRARRIVLVGLMAHLTGTFLTFIDAPSWMMHNHNLMLLNMDGEFVLKNLVLISAALVLLGATSAVRSGRAPINPAGT
ncbi:MAG TPA: DoxX family protein [Pseudonocardiaceae bacterium]|jgi:uncharacterized membrane protein YphA (DoxX/SURF4 family)|nr:DoxX family protein [Pseudonocardiaceae bacterium]